MRGNFIRKIILRKISKFQNLDGWLTDNEAIGLYIVARKLTLNATVVEMEAGREKVHTVFQKAPGRVKYMQLTPLMQLGGSMLKVK